MASPQAEHSHASDLVLERLNKLHPKLIDLSLDRVEYWKSKGAKLSPTVTGLVKKAGASIAKAA